MARERARTRSVTEPLSVTHPELAAEWHPTKNGDRTPNDVTAGSNKKAWWQCLKGPDHEWQASMNSRTSGGRLRGCPYCAGQKVSVTNSLAAHFPEIAAQWHPTKNGDLTPSRITSRSGIKVWWLCSIITEHEWQATVASRTDKANPHGCPCCAGRKVSATNSLAARFPDIVAQWHLTKNGGLKPDEVPAGSHLKVWWKCPKGPDHEWQTRVTSRTSRAAGCPYCAGQKTSITNSLGSLFPEIAAQWHPTKNGTLTPDLVVAGSNKNFWWQCPNSADHQWRARLNARTYNNAGCPFCSGLKASVTNSLAALFPTIAADWHPTKNGDLLPSMVVGGSQIKVWWRCPEGPDHEWEAMVSNRTRLGSGCPCCANQKPSVSNSLQSRFPDVAAQWHPLNNGELTPDKVVAGSNLKVWWRCSNGPDHEWQATVSHRTSGDRRTGCPRCNKGWTLDGIRAFVASLKEHLPTFSAAELYLLFQQNGLLTSTGKGKTFVNALTTGRFPKAEIEKFVNGEPSLVDEFVQDPTQTLDALDTTDEKSVTVDDPIDHADDLVGNQVQADDQQLPVVETKDVLGSLSLHVVSSADKEAVEFLLASAVAKIWKHAYRNEDAAVVQADTASVDGYAEQVRTRFLDEYHQVKDLALPGGYAFQVNGKPTPPNLMQRHFAVRVRERKRVGNWSGTGSGKTLAAVLATRVVGSKLTIVCCPNSVVEGWRQTILDIFPDSAVETKTLNPDWAAIAGDATGFGVAADQRTHRYLVLNYEAFQQPESAERVRSLVEREPIDFVIVDEIHYAKQRAVENISQRRQLVAALTTLAAERNPDLHVLGMSATPVINNLQEGKSMVELVSGVAHEELDTRSTVPNCMRLHQRLVTLGIRWMPEYDLGYEQCETEVHCGQFLDEIRALGGRGTPLALEQILTRARLPVIRASIEPKTLIYTHYVQGIDRLLRDALVEDGWKVGFFTGEDKSGLDGFLKGDVDVLIGSSAIGTGVDGLQRVCNRLIVNVLPWTAAEFEQLKGRVYRQGQSREKVTLILPLTYAEVHGQRWSWCESKMQRLRFKKSIADAAVDGVVPEGHLRTEAQAYQDVMAWLERLDAGEVAVITRPRIVVPLPDTDPADVKRRGRRYGDFSGMNRKWNQSRSEGTHARLQENPEEWAQYHTLYREARKDWAVVPYEEMIRWCRQRSGYVIGDFGCGEAKLAEAVSDRHTVHSFDHLAANDAVVACDMAHVPLDDETLDVAIFSLSLMGANFADYIREAYRTLKLDGQLHIIEATERFSDREQFARMLKQFGFGGIAIEDKWKFTHMQAWKTERGSDNHVEIRF